MKVINSQIKDNNMSDKNKNGGGHPPDCGVAWDAVYHGGIGGQKTPAAQSPATQPSVVLTPPVLGTSDSGKTDAEAVDGYSDLPPPAHG